MALAAVPDPTEGVYQASPIKRRRRTKAAMDEIRYALRATLDEHKPMTVRQVFYALTTQGAIEKTEAEYGTVCRLLAEMRRSGEIPYDWLADATRWQRRPRAFSSVEDALRATAQMYRRRLWDRAPVAVEVWLEKEALAGVLYDVTAEWDVPLMTTRGYPSMSYLYSAAVEIKARLEKAGQRTQLYYFGDHDPSGTDIDRAVVSGIGESLLAQDGSYDVDDIEKEDAFYEYADFERVGVTTDQIADWSLPTRPTKKTDTRSKGFSGGSVELDAIPVEQLRELAGDAIRRHVDERQLDVLLTYEEAERKDLMGIATYIAQGGSL